MKEKGTYKEFSAMLKEVARIIGELGDESIFSYEHSDQGIEDMIYQVTRKHDYKDFIEPWMMSFGERPINVKEAKKNAARIKATKNINE